MFSAERTGTKWNEAASPFGNRSNGNGLAASFYLVPRVSSVISKARRCGLRNTLILRMLSQIWVTFITASIPHLREDRYEEQQ